MELQQDVSGGGRTLLRPVVGAGTRGNKKGQAEILHTAGGSGWEHPGAGAIRAQLLSRHMSAVENSRGDGQGRGEVLTVESATEGKGVKGAVTEGQKDGG